MTGSWRQWLEQSLSALMVWVHQFRLLIIGLAVISMLICVVYTADHLGMNTDTRDMLSSDLPWRQVDQQIDMLFPQYTDKILVVIEAPTPDQARDSADLLNSKLRNEHDLFKSVYYPGGSDFFKTNALLYLDINELQDLADQLAKIQPFLARLIEDQSLRGLFRMLDEALVAIQEGEDVDLDPLLIRINNVMSAQLEGRSQALSWQALMGGVDVEKPLYREFIILQPVLDYGGLFPAKPAMLKLRSLADAIHTASDNTIRIRLTGSAALSYEEMLSVSQGTVFSSVASFILVTLILFIGLRSFHLTFASLITLLAGLIYTAAFAALSVGELNLISVAFAVLYIGLGADFAIHFCLRYRELISQQQEHLIALRKTAADTGLSLVLCAGTTALGFYAFTPTDYDGVAELGLISGTGMIISLVITLTLLPALLGMYPLNPEKLKPLGKDTPRIIKLRRLPYRYAGKILMVTAVLTVASLYAMTRLEFDHNTLNLQSQKNESVKTYRDLLADSDTSPWISLVLTHSAEETVKISQQLEKLPLVNKVVSALDLVPEQQDEKLLIIEEMDLLLGPLTLTVDSMAPPNDTERLAALHAFHTALATLPASMSRLTAYQQLHKTLGRFLETLNHQDEQTRQRSLQVLEHNLLDTFAGRLDTLLTALGAEPFSLETLPAEIRDRWISNGSYRVEIYPRENLMDNHALREFVNEIRTVAPDVSGSPVISIEASDAVVGAFQQAFLYALIATCLLLLVLTDRPVDTVYILIPLLLAALFTGGISVVFDMPLNFANIIALPLLLAIGMDSGIHILNRARNAAPEDGELLASSSARAVICSALTTIASIGNLALSPHLGTASMGKLLTIGLIMTLICTLVILPSLLPGHLHPKEHS